VIGLKPGRKVALSTTTRELLILSTSYPAYHNRLRLCGVVKGKWAARMIKRMINS
jgi:hypothetical protein